MDMTEYLMSVAMYSLKYAEAFGYKEDDVSYALGRVFRNYQDDVKEYSNQELSLLVTLLSKVEEKEYKEYIKIYNLDVIKLIIKYAKDVKDSLNLANLVKEEYHNSSNDLKKLEEIMKGRG